VRRALQALAKGMGTRAIAYCLFSLAWTCMSIAVIAYMSYMGATGKLARFDALVVEVHHDHRFSCAKIIGHHEGLGVRMARYQPTALLMQVGSVMYATAMMTYSYLVLARVIDIAPLLSNGSVA